MGTKKSPPYSMGIKKNIPLWGVGLPGLITRLFVFSLLKAYKGLMIGFYFFELGKVMDNPVMD
jgi:hypothetical protein